MLAAVGGSLVDVSRPATALRCAGDGPGANRDLEASPLSLTTAGGPLGRDAERGTVDTVSFELAVESGSVACGESAVGVTAERHAPIQVGDDEGDQIHLTPGETHRWSLSRVPHPTPNDPNTTVLVEDLEPGRYWFGVRLAHDPAGEGAERDCVAKRAFRVVA